MPTPHPSVLQLVPRAVELSMLDGDVLRRPVSHFLDLVVDGQSLLDLAHGEGTLVTELNRPWLRAVPQDVEVLLGRRPHPELAPGRVALLVCSVDGDLGCGAVTAALQVSPDAVTWSGFRWEDGLREPHAAAGLPEAVVFDRRQYEDELEQAADRVASLPYDEREHRRRPFLWPWQWGWRLPPSD